MANVKPFQTLGGIKKAAAWFTPVLVGAANGFEFKPPHGISSDRGVFANQQIFNSADERAGDLGNFAVSGSVGMEFVFETAGLPLALTLGTAGAPTQSGADLAYVHKLRMLDDIEGKFGTLVFPAGLTEVEEFPSVKFDGFSFSVSSVGPAAITYNALCDSVNFNSGSGTNKNSTVGSITLPTVRQRALGNAMTLRMNAQGGAALAVGDKVECTDFAVDFKRGLVGKYTSTSQTKMDEPHPTSTPGFVEVTGSFTMPYYNAAAISARTQAFAKDQLKADFNILGPIAAGTTAYNVAIYLNAIQLTGKPVPGTDGTKFTFKAHGAAAVPTGFPTGLSQSIGIDLTNTFATDLLA
jgi:hypothetical protein